MTSGGARIARVDVFRQAYTVAGGSFSMSGGKSAARQDATLVRLETVDGLVGWGEQCGFSPRYLATHGEGVRAAMTLLGPTVLGQDSCSVDLVNDAMDGALKGHLDAKSAVDIACWDLLGQRTGLSVSELLGGARRHELPLYVGIGVDTPERMREACRRAVAAGYRRVQLKVGTDAATDIARVEACLEVLDGLDRVIVDANGFWSQHEAIRVVSALDHHDIVFEQPCRSMEECGAVRRRSRRAFVLDESIEGPDDLLRARRTDAADAVMLKFSRFGGITAIRRARDLALQLGFAMTIEDSAGGDVVSAAMAHVGATVPDHALVNGSLIGRMVDERTVSGWSPLAGGGIGVVPSGPGLGIVVDEGLLGQPVASYTDGGGRR